MSYMSRDNAVAVLKRMRDFHHAQVKLHQKHGMDFVQNLGRRNIVMSHAQEIFLAQELSVYHEQVVADGRTGQPDIILHSLARELECKITSANSKTGKIEFRTDYGTLRQKEQLDYFYIIASDDFEKFAALHFEGLTHEDFRVPSPGGRDKSGMIKHLGMKKCNVLVGKAVTQNDSAVSSLEEEMLILQNRYFDEQEICNVKKKELTAFLYRIETKGKQIKVPGRRKPLIKLDDKLFDSKTIRKKSQALAKEFARPKVLHDEYCRRCQKIQNKQSQIRNRVPQYSFELESI